MHACCVRHLRRRCGYSPGLLQEHSSLTEQATGNLRFSGFRSSGKHAFGRASGTAPSERNQRPPPFQQLCRKRRRQRPVSASRAKRPSPALHQKRSAARVRSGKNGAGARSRSPVRRPRRLQSMFQTPSLLRGTPARRARLRRLFGTGLLCRNLLGGTRLLDCRLPA